MSERERESERERKRAKREQTRTFFCQKPLPETQLHVTNVVHGSTDTRGIAKTIRGELEPMRTKLLETITCTRHVLLCLPSFVCHLNKKMMHAIVFS